MKRWLILAALVVALSAAATVAVQYMPADTSGDDLPVSWKVEGPVPKAVVTEPLTYTFEAKPQHTTFKRDWVVKNEGEADLILSPARSTCSCTVAEFEKKGRDEATKELRIKPGESSTIHMTFETRNFNNDHDWSSTVTTNDPKTPEISFAAKGKVYPALVLYPPDRTLDFAGIPNDTDHSARVALSSPDRPELKILKVTTSKPGLLVANAVPLTADERKELKVKGNAYRINITIKPGLPLGSVREEVIVQTDHPQEPELVLTVAGKVTGPIEVINGPLRMINVSSSQGGQGSLKLMVRGRRPTKFTVEYQPEKLKVDVTPSTPDSKGGEYRVNVTIPPGTPVGVIEDQIVLKTDHPQAATVKIPVSIYIRDKG